MGVLLEEPQCAYIGVGFDRTIIRNEEVKLEFQINSVLCLSIQ